MTKKEFMAFSLPYELTGMYLNDLVRIDFGSIGSVLMSGSKTKPIVHPLSDIIKPIDHKGERLTPIERIFNKDINIIRCYESSNYYLIDYGTITDPITYFIKKDIALERFFIIQFLVNYHFDLFNGIESGEAIDVNTIENPYK
jgi:hypothetical protein